MLLNKHIPVSFILKKIRLELMFVCIIGLVITLSISLSGIEIYCEIPLLLVVSSVFFLLEGTATHLQDPLESRPTDTAMTAIATTIEINLKHLVNEKDIPQPQTAEQYYLL